MTTPAAVPAGDEDLSYSATAVVQARGHGLPLEKLPRNVQRIDRAALDQDHPLGLNEVLEQRLGSVVINDVQNNPLQPDLQYRGFTASPLLGSPQGIAVYQDGVRIHDAFGDVVQWDLVPEFAVQEVQLQPGANPLYGLNALGGGLSLRMKDGFSAPGTRIDALAGSFGRYQASGEYGKRYEDGWAVYGGASLFGERGFRDESQSSARHFYGDFRQRGDDHELGASLTVADTDLNGNGPVPIELLEQRRASLFTYPDNTRNRLAMVAVDGRRDLSSQVSLQGNVYFRHLQRDTFNGDAADLQACDDAAGDAIVCDEDDEPLQSESGGAIPASDPDYDALYNRTATTGDGFGAALQASVDAPLAERANQLVVGTTYDGSHAGFLQRAELGHLTPDRSVSGDAIFVGGDGFRTKLDVDNDHFGVFAVDTFTPVEPLSLQLSARFNFSDVRLRDRLGDALDGHHTFDRVNPALGLTYRPLRELTVFASYGESSRAPSAIELSCADPGQPCRVPNAFLADPPLSQVVTRALELGVRGTAGGSHAHPALSWSLAGFGSRNGGDIIFVAGSQVGTGFFQNAGKTQRVGLEAALDGKTGPLRAYASYSLLRATFETPLQLPGIPEGNGDDAALVDVERGDRIPGLPTHSVKAGVSVSPIPDWDLGVSVVASSSRPFRGDEGNEHSPVPGYAVLSAHMGYWLLPGLQLFVKAQNLLDSEYETFGLLADPSDVLPDDSDPRFLGPGAPFGLWAGVVVRDL
jgi:outer membrane receptor protein involved in Fe transport